MNILRKSTGGKNNPANNKSVETLEFVIKGLRRRIRSLNLESQNKDFIIKALRDECRNISVPRPGTKVYKLGPLDHNNNTYCLVSELNHGCGIFECTINSVVVNGDRIVVSFKEVNIFASTYNYDEIYNFIYFDKDNALKALTTFAPVEGGDSE